MLGLYLPVVFLGRYIFANFFLAVLAQSYSRVSIERCSLALLVQKYLLTGAQVQILTLEERQEAAIDTQAHTSEKNHAGDSFWTSVPVSKAFFTSTFSNKNHADGTADAQDCGADKRAARRSY